MDLKLYPPMRVTLITFLSLLITLAAVAQVTEATLKLSIADVQSNSVAGASIEITNEDTGIKRTVVTDNNGQVMVAGLPSGSYAVSLKDAGFKTFSQKNLKLNVGQMAELKILLSVGDVEEVVNIEAGAAQLQVATEGRVSDTLDQKKVSELPIPQRDVYALPKLSSGATFIPGAANSTKLTNSPVVTVNGNRYRGNNYVLDGAMNSNSNWQAYTTAARKYETVSRELKLHVSFAISMANGCRYCTLHQVLGLRRLGVDPGKLVTMAKDDSALTPRELAAVVFARKITREPARLTKEDYAALVSEFKEQGGT
jgi:AhpD family alkylhydroperoxidase